MPLFTREDREAVGAGAAALAVTALGLALVALVSVAMDDDAVVRRVAASGSATVTLAEFSLSPESVSVPLDGSLAVTNGGTVEHNLAVDGTDLKTADLAARRVRFARPLEPRARHLHDLLRHLRAQGSRDESAISSSAATPMPAMS